MRTVAFSTRKSSTTAALPDSSDRLPPSDEAAERGLLACALLDSSAVPDICRLPEECFYALANRATFRAIRALHRDGAGVDILTVRAKLKSDRQLEGIGEEFLATLPEAAPSAANLPAYRGILLDLHKRRLAIATAEEVARAAFNLSVPMNGQLARAAVAFADCADPEAAPIPAFEDVAALAAEPLPTPPAVIEGLLRRGEKAVLGGASKTFKSWMALDIALCVSHGLPWLGHDVAVGRVLMVNLELPRWCIRKRLADVATARNVKLEAGRLLVYTLRGFRVTAQELRASIAQRKIHDLALVIVDPAYKLLSGHDENSAGDIAELLGHFEGITADTGAAVLVPTHFAKGNASGKESQDRISGSGVFARDPDSILTLTRHEEENAFTVEATLRTFAPVAPFVVRWSHPVFSVDGSLDPARLKKPRGPTARFTREQVLALLPSAGISKAEWRQKASDALGIGKTKFYELTAELLEAGRLEANGDKLCPVTLTSSKPYAD